MLIVVLVAGVLITPDPGEDVNGTLQERQTLESLFLIPLSFSPFSFPQTPVNQRSVPSAHSLTSDPPRFMLCPELLARATAFFAKSKTLSWRIYATVFCFH
jgi:hypothetical protein